MGEFKRQNSKREKNDRLFGMLFDKVRKKVIHGVCSFQFSILHYNVSLHKIKTMKYLILVLLSVMSLSAYSQLDRKAIYTALASDSKEVVQKQLEGIQDAKESSEVKAFKGALQMKAAQFQKTAKDKMNLFNTGKKLLESEIKSNDGNVEYRFLRLLIQENAPKQLKYNGNIEEDVMSIVAGYSKLKESTKTALESYAKKSTSLKGLL